MFRILLAVIVCVLMIFRFQLLHVIELADSHPNIPAGTERANNYNKLLRKISRRTTSLLLRKIDLLDAKLVIEDLNSSWADNDAAIKVGGGVTITGALNTLFSTIGAIASGGTSVVATVAVTGPGFISAVTTYKAASKTDSARLKRTEFVKAFSVALGGYDAAIAFQESEHDEYTDFYFEYLQMEVDHDGGLYTGVNGSALTVEQLYKSINCVPVTLNSDGSRVFGELVDGCEKKEEGYFHLITDRYGNSLGSTDHDMDPHYSWEKMTVSELPLNKACYGASTCQKKFRNYYDAYMTHRKKCGTAESFSQLVRETMHQTHPIDVWSFRIILNDRTVEQGCGKEWYNCDSIHNTMKERHRVRTCKIEIPQKGGGTDRCKDGFRKCMGHKKDHDKTRWNRNTLHSDDAADESADAGDDTDNTDDSSSAMHACGIHATTVSGSHSRITPPCGDSAHAGYACQISSDHKTEMSGWRGPFYECQPHTTYPCSHTDPTANQAYHAPRSSCTQTNANGQSCTVTNFYDCDQHTHVYPAPTISCGRSACSQTVSSSTQNAL